MIHKSFKPFNDIVMEKPYKHSTIKDLSEEDRPREKMLKKGAEALSVAELLAIIIGGGTTDKTAVELMQEVMDECENKLLMLSRLTIDDLMSYKGIGEAKAVSIMAAAEIGRRRLMEKANDLQQMDNGEMVYKYMLPRIQDLTHEESWALLLNNDARLLRCVNLSKGGMTDTTVDARMIMRQALLANSTCFVLVHNHPSGKLTPSRCDNELTEKVKRAGQTMNIHMSDHVIVTDGDYYSYAENGKL